MSLPRSCAALAAVTMIVASLPLLVTAPAQAAERTPLTVRLTRITPAIPQSGPVVLSGRLINTSGETWQDINVAPFVSAEPMTSRTELAEAATLEEDVEVGARLTTVGLFASVGDLPPGASTTFRISLPRRMLPISGDAGVYWIGVHALGTNTEGRDALADGRVRTFIPLVPRGEGRTSVAVVLPLREPVVRDDDGKVRDAEDWLHRFEPNGRLSRILDIAESAGSLPFTWLMDPAVLDAAAELDRDNPGLSFGSPRPVVPTQSPSPSASAEAGPGPEVAEGPSSVAGEWLDRVQVSAQGQAVLGLPYADPDVAALARLRPGLLEQAADLAETSFAEREISADPAVAPPSGWVTDDAATVLGDRGYVLASDHALPRRRTLWSLALGPTLALTDALSVRGGPAPTAPLHALALRQRILADAALRALEGIRSPMQVLLPADWEPGAGWRQAEFLESLDRHWLSLVELAPETEPPVYPRPLPYPENQADAEISSFDISAAAGLADVGSTYRDLLDTTNDIFDSLLGAGLAATSYAARDEESEARDAVISQTDTLTDLLDGVRVDLGDEFVTLSGGSGTLTVSLENDLKQPVVIGVSASTNNADVRLTSPEPIRVAPGQRTSMRLKAVASQIGVHAVTLTPVTASGRAVGEPLEFSLRTSEVGRLIWIILIGGAVLLAVMIVRRIVLRIHSHRWRQ